MKAWRVNQWCEPEEMEFAEIPLPEPKPERPRNTETPDCIGTAFERKSLVR